MVSEICCSTSSSSSDDCLAVDRAFLPSRSAYGIHDSDKTRIVSMMVKVSTTGLTNLPARIPQDHGETPCQEWISTLGLDSEWSDRA